MTSREQTGFMPKDHASDAHVTWRDRLVWTLFAPFTAPFLLKSLRGGSKVEKKRLLDRLDLADDALPNLGSWKADTGFLHLIVDTILERKPQRVVEFGCGASSLVISKALEKAGGGNLTSFDQHEDFVAKTRDWLAGHGLNADITYAPLAPSPDGWPGLFYAIPPLEPGIDLIIVDGPPWTIHPMTRGAADQLFDRLAPGGMILLDDAARPGERIIASRWKKRHPDIDFTYWSGGEKGTLIGVRKA